MAKQWRPIVYGSVYGSVYESSLCPECILTFDRNVLLWQTELIKLVAEAAEVIEAAVLVHALMVCRGNLRFSCSWLLHLVFDVFTVVSRCLGPRGNVYGATRRLIRVM